MPRRMASAQILQTAAEASLQSGTRIASVSSDVGHSRSHEVIGSESSSFVGVSMSTSTSSIPRVRLQRPLSGVIPVSTIPAAADVGLARSDVSAVGIINTAYS